MGEAEIDAFRKIITIHSHIITYGDAADAKLTENIRAEIETMWNEPQGTVIIKKIPLNVVFRITAELRHSMDVTEVYSNINPCNNYFRIEEYAHGNISFVDGIGCNSGYFKIENLYTGSTRRLMNMDIRLDLIIQRIWIFVDMVCRVLCTRGEHWLTRNFSMILQNQRELQAAQCIQCIER